YGDWTLVLAAYNCGPGNVNKARARAGAAARNFWDIYDYLPRETRTYVPLFIAATYAYTYHKQHGIDITPRSTPLVVDTVAVRRLVHLEQVATALELPVETVRALNPQYIKDIVPAIDKPYPIVLPHTHVASYIERDSLVHLRDSVYLAEYLNPANVDATRKLIASAGAAGTTHRVRKGETLGGIARRYGVSTSQLVRWNNLKSANRLSIGQRLEIRK
ncbi:MAG: LysM peptidoglycan-binding domain-containing protein, partial [Alistipes sp.]|nr:LysM peptidoglycan-binding domain-containing protein [Alistipes sp.]